MLVAGGTTDPSPRCILDGSGFCTHTPDLADFTASGQLDHGFGRNGILGLGSLADEFADFGGPGSDETLGVLFLRELPDGTVLAGGGTETAAFLVEIDGSGKLVGGFGDGGIVTRTNPSRADTELR